MLVTSPDSPTELRRKVTSPGGTTQAAITHMEGHGLPVTQRNRAGLVQQQHVHVARCLDGAAAGGDDIGAHHAIHARPADGRSAAPLR